MINDIHHDKSYIHSFVNIHIYIYICVFYIYIERERYISSTGVCLLGIGRLPQVAIDILDMRRAIKERTTDDSVDGSTYSTTTI